MNEDMVQGIKAVLARPEGQALATKSRMKPIYSALTSLAEIVTSHQGNTSERSSTPLSPGAIAATATEPQITRARSVVDMLLEHSDMPGNASYDDLITHAEASYKVVETLGGGSSCDTSLDCLLSQENMSIMSPCAFDPESGRASSRTSGRVVFTPTANLDCSPANCSPISVFESERADSCTPSAMNRHMYGHSLGSTPGLHSEGSSPALASTSGLSPTTWDSSVRDGSSSRDMSNLSSRDSMTPRRVVTPRTPNHDVSGVPAVFRGKQLRVRTRIPE